TANDTDPDLTDPTPQSILNNAPRWSHPRGNPGGPIAVANDSYRNHDKVEVSKKLEAKEYYFELFLNQGIDKPRIYTLTAKINNCLHSEFGIKNLYHRMIFTACALVAKRYGAFMQPGMDYSTFHNSILSCLRKELTSSKNKNDKLDLLVEVYSEIKMNINLDPDSPSDQQRLLHTIGEFIEWIEEISESIDSNEWNGEDVMGIFFNEFNRYKAKSESGQVFTPDHITSFMCRILEVNENDVVLDAACGSGAFLVKAMAIMTRQAGGFTTRKAKEVRQAQLYGIEFDREIFALACANMLIHKDGKTNLTHLDSRTESSRRWIESRPKEVTKVLMNPPYENKHGCMDIVASVLSAVPPGTKCAFILPDKKLEKTSKKKIQNMLKYHRLTDIIKLPEKLFFKIGATTSIFVFETGVPQGGRKIFGAYIADDSLITIKNQGRQDVQGVWPELEEYWVDCYFRKTDDRFGTSQWIDPEHNLSYQLPVAEFRISAEDFRQVALEHLAREKNVDLDDLRARIFELVMNDRTDIDFNGGMFSVSMKMGSTDAD
ncbi:HsdM family class I SAM-dependent methyltransferase, partial [Gordonia amicalis]|uniref:HsdM family class I SAM-dependent methyltransferase n=1 Tax=Gordonia amicalis TaxID=89053 RepID=UPI0015F4E419